MSSTMWGYQEAFLGDRGVRCVSFDRRGHGRSDASNHGYDMDTFAYVIGAVIEGLDLRDVVLVGHSMGGGEILRYVGRHGASRVTKIVLLASITPFVLLTANNSNDFPAEVFEQVSAQWGTDFPRWVEDNKLPFFTKEASPAIIAWIQEEALRVHVQTPID